MTALLQLPAELQMVVDLPVVGHYDLTVFVGQGLRAAFDVDDAESHVCETNSLSDIEPVPVGPAMPDRGGHPPERFDRHSRWRLPGDSRDPAHQSVFAELFIDTDSTSCGPRCR